MALRVEAARPHGELTIAPEAQELWNDEDRIEIPAGATDEPRFLVIGNIADKHWSVVVTRRNERIRIISVRRSREEEIELYEG